jgi:hypothetical protein
MEQKGERDCGLRRRHGDGPDNCSGYVEMDVTTLASARALYP